MPLKIAIQMDAIEHINIKSDTSFALALEAQNRGHQLFYYQPSSMFLEAGNVMANLQKIKLQDDEKDYFILGDIVKTDLATMDVVLMRQDPPYDMNYLTYTYMLERIHPNTLVVNNPREVRNCPEKLFVFDFPEFIIPTVISADKTVIEDFAKRHEQIILKPLYAHGGMDVFKVENNLDEIADQLFAKYNMPIIAQKFLKEVVDGDKRIILLNGEPVGAVNRIPEEGSIRSNFVQGGAGEKTELTQREIEICEALKPILVEKELFFVGIDVIGGYLSEINVTSPTGVKIINKLDKVCLEAKFWDFIEEKLA